MMYAESKCSCSCRTAVFIYMLDVITFIADYPYVYVGEDFVVSITWPLTLP